MIHQIIISSLYKDWAATPLINVIIVVMDILIILFLAVVGAAMGSFVGALTWRMKKGMDFVSDRSECEHCHHKLSAFDLMPIFSWLVLRGRCRYCRKKIGAETLILEIAVAATFALSFMFWPLGEFYVNGAIIAVQVSLFGLWLVMVVIMAALFTYDFRWRILPNRLVFPLMLFAFVFAILNKLFIQNLSLLNSFYEMILSLIPITGIYGLIYVFSKGELIGFGDVKFGIAAGLILGWQGALLVLVLSNTLGSLAVLPMLVRKKMNINSQIAFGPFLILSTFIVFLLQPVIMDFFEKNLLLL